MSKKLIPVEITLPLDVLDFYKALSNHVGTSLNTVLVSTLITRLAQEDANFKNEFVKNYLYDKKPTKKNKK
jgi:hypothetical protein